MPLKAKEVSEQLTLRQFTYVCNVLDSKHGARQYFDVVSIKRETEKLFVLVCLEGGILETLEVAA